MFSPFGSGFECLSNCQFKDVMRISISRTNVEKSSSSPHSRRSLPGSDALRLAYCTAHPVEWGPRTVSKRGAEGPLGRVFDAIGAQECLKREAPRIAVVVSERLGTRRSRRGDNKRGAPLPIESLCTARPTTGGPTPNTHPFFSPVKSGGSDRPGALEDTPPRLSSRPAFEGWFTLLPSGSRRLAARLD